VRWPGELGDTNTSAVETEIRNRAHRPRTRQPIAVSFCIPASAIDPDAPVIERLALAHCRVLCADTFPVFGASEAPRSFDHNRRPSPISISIFWTSLILPMSFWWACRSGGWIAAEMAIKSTARISHLVLGNAVGIKVGRPARDRDHIGRHLCHSTRADFLELAYRNPDAGKRDYKGHAGRGGPPCPRATAKRRRVTPGRPTCMTPSSGAGCIAFASLRCFLLGECTTRVPARGLWQSLLRGHPRRVFSSASRGLAIFPHVEQASEFAEKKSSPSWQPGDSKRKRVWSCRGRV